MLLTTRRLSELEVGADVVRIPCGHPEQVLRAQELPERMWVKVAGRRLTAPLCTDLVVSLSREQDLALARVGHAFDFFLRPPQIQVVETRERLVFMTGGEILVVLRDTLRPPKGVYDEDDFEGYILGWIVAWRIGELLG